VLTRLLNLPLELTLVKHRLSINTTHFYQIINALATTYSVSTQIDALTTIFVISITTLDYYTRKYHKADIYFTHCFVRLYTILSLCC
jgi:hypothetical protein